MLFRILHNILIVCVVLGFQDNFFGKGGMTSANFHYESLNTLVGPNSPYNQISIQDSQTAVFLNLQSNINTCINQNALNDNLLSLGDIGYLITAAINFCIPDNPGDYGIPSLDDCLSDTCNKARAIINNNGTTPLFSTFQLLGFGAVGLCGNGQFYGAILFDTRAEAWTSQNTSNAVSFVLSEILPTLS